VFPQRHSNPIKPTFLLQHSHLFFITVEVDAVVEAVEAVSFETTDWFLSPDDG
jgi:hypothetical protein